MRKVMASDAIIFISGASGVGKTSISRKLLEHFPEIMIIQEVDLIRETIRSYNENVKIELMKIGNEYKINKELDYDLINKSTSELSIDELLKQAFILIRPLKKICERLKQKQIPSIIEGANIVFSQLLSINCENGYFLNSNNMMYINLYTSDKNIHYDRINNRLVKQSLNKIHCDSFTNIRMINDFLFQQTVSLQERFKNTEKILNIDTISDDDNEQLVSMKDAIKRNLFTNEMV